MKLQEIVTFSKLSYYDGKLKTYIAGLLSGKADKVTGATTGNFAGLDENGNLTDSGKKAADFAAANHVHGNIGNDGKMTDTAAGAANGDKLVVASSNGTVKQITAEFDGSTTNKALTPKGTFESFLQEHQDITGKADKVSGATADNFAGLDANGNLKDSGKSASDFATDTQGGYADSALQSISNGTDGSYVTTTIGSKSGSAGAKDQTIGVAVTVQPMSSAGSSNMGLAEASDVKSYIDNKVAAGINYKGSVQNYSALPANPNVGDMYNVIADEGTPGTSGFHPGDMNYIWAAANGDDPSAEGYVPAHWDPQSPIIVVTECTNAQIDTLFPAS